MIREDDEKQDKTKQLAAITVETKQKNPTISVRKPGGEPSAHS